MSVKVQDDFYTFRGDLVSVIKLGFLFHKPKHISDFNKPPRLRGEFYFTFAADTGQILASGDTVVACTKNAPHAANYIEKHFLTAISAARDMVANKHAALRIEAARPELMAAYDALMMRLRPIPSPPANAVASPSFGD